MNLPSLLCQMNVCVGEENFSTNVYNESKDPHYICSENVCLVSLYCAWYNEAIWLCQQREGAGFYILTLLPC